MSFAEIEEDGRIQSAGMEERNIWAERRAIRLPGNTKKAKRAREAPENYTHRISLRRKKNMYGLINMHTTKINIPRAQLYSCQYSIA